MGRRSGPRTARNVDRNHWSRVEASRVVDRKVVHATAWRMLGEMGKLPCPSPEEIEMRMTENGGWTKRTLQMWGVPWPPPKGWRQELENRYKLQNAPR